MNPSKKCAEWELADGYSLRIFGGEKIEVIIKKLRSVGSDFAERPLRLVEQNQVPRVSSFFILKI